MTRRLSRSRLVIASWLVLSSVSLPAQQEVRARIDTFFGLPDLPNGEWGSIYHVYDTRQSLRVVWGFKNESDRSLQVPADFLSRLRFVLSRGAVNVELSVEWEDVNHISELVADIVPAGLAITLGPGDTYSGAAVLAARLTDGEQRLTMKVTAAIEALTWSDGTPWRGRHFGDAQVVVRVLKPETLAERRSYHLIESNLAFKRGDTDAALRHARDVLKENPKDAGGHDALARIFMKLGRYRDAIAELQLVKTMLPRPGPLIDLSPRIDLSLAYSYLAIGDEQKATELVRAVYPPADVRPTLEQMRADLRREGVIR